MTSAVPKNLKLQRPRNMHLEPKRTTMLLEPREGLEVQESGDKTVAETPTDTPPPAGEKDDAPWLNFRTHADFDNYVETNKIAVPEVWTTMNLTQKAAWLNG